MVVLDTRLNWSTHVDQFRKKASHRLCVLGELSVTEEIACQSETMFCSSKQLTHPITNYASCVCRPAALTCVRTLQVLQSESLRIASYAPWYFGDMHICEDLGVPYFVDHIRAITECTDSNLAGVLNLLFR